ncbi:CBS domain-containing protein [Geothermobacter hydrogeniphilus]|nr:CBS domain-containing protein [Geothermobacter hydrogeniphilus]
MSFELLVVREDANRQDACKQMQVSGVRRVPAANDSACGVKES